MPPNREAPSLLRTESWGSASVTWLDRPGARRVAARAAAELARRQPEITGVLLFGSIARGDAVPSSDVDLLIVLRESELPFLDRIPRYTPAIPPLAVDVLPYTEREFRDLCAEGHRLIAAALAEGEWVVGPPEGLVTTPAWTGNADRPATNAAEGIRRRDGSPAGG
jgi:uncharacterized protein